MSLSQPFLFISCHFPSHSGSLLLSQLDKPDVPLIRHTNVISFLYNHPFSCFHALSPNLRNLLDSSSQQRARLHQLQFHLFAACLGATCCSAVDHDCPIKGPHKHTRPARLKLMELPTDLMLQFNIHVVQQNLFVHFEFFMYLVVKTSHWHTVSRHSAHTRTHAHWGLVLADVVGNERCRR